MKVLFCDDNGCIPYVKNTHVGHVHRFLCLENQGHLVLVACSSFFTCHDDIPKPEQIIGDVRIVGAGKIGYGCVNSWISACLRIETPEHIRHKIADALGVEVYESVGDKDLSKTDFESSRAAPQSSTKHE